MAKATPLFSAVGGCLAAYLLGYGVARVFVFHAVEHYAGAEGKGGPRQDFIAKRDHPPGAGWEYGLFLPAIKLEEAIANGFRNR